MGSKKNGRIHSSHQLSLGEFTGQRKRVRLRDGETGLWFPPSFSPSDPWAVFPYLSGRGSGEVGEEGWRRPSHDHFDPIRRL